MTRALLILAVAATGLGCGVDFTRWDPDRFSDGDRIRFQHWRPESGESVVYGLWDAELGQRCTVRETVEGALRCVPRTAGPMHYRDPGCAGDPVYRGDLVDHLGCGAVYAAERLFDERLGRSRWSAVARVGESLEPGLTPLFVRSIADGTCVPDGSSATLWALERVPLTDLVEVERTVLGRGGGLEEVRWDFSDGAHRRQRFFADGQACELWDLDGDPDVRRCLADALPDAFPRYGDPDCRARIAPDIADDAAPPFVLAFDARRGIYAARPVGERLTDVDEYRLQPDGTCRFVATASSRRALLPPLSPDEFPRYERVQDGRGASGRLRYDRWVGPDGRVAPFGADQAHEFLFDAELGIRCVWTRLGGDEVRCLPPRADVSPLYTDPECRRLVFAGWPNAPFGLRLRGARRDTCGRESVRVDEVWRLGEPVASETTLWALDERGCFRTEQRPEALYRPGEQLTLDVFGRMEEVRQ